MPQDFRVKFTQHAMRRIFERDLDADAVAKVSSEGETIEKYPEDRPHPSRLILGMAGETPIHIVVAEDPEERVRYIVTVYVPDPLRWTEDFRRRRP